MRQIISLSRNFYVDIDKDENFRPICETIIAYTDGKDYTINNMMETTRSQRISEVRLDIPLKQIDEIIDYLEDVRLDLIKFEAKVNGLQKKEEE